MAKDVLYGNRAEGLYGVAGTSKFSVASVTSSGVSITTTATRQAPAPATRFLHPTHASRPYLWQDSSSTSKHAVVNPPHHRTPPNAFLPPCHTCTAP